MLREEFGNLIEVDIITDVTHNECLDRKKRCDIFFSQIQIGVGTYGKSAVEAASFGIPVLCWFAEESLYRAKGILDDCPFINVTIDSLYSKLRDLILSENYRREVGKKTREWCIKVHGFDAVGKQYIDLYHTLLDNVQPPIKQEYVCYYNTYLSAKDKYILQMLEYYESLAQVQPYAVTDLPYSLAGQRAVLDIAIQRRLIKNEKA